MSEYFLEIEHAPFSDGTPRHPLLSIKIPDDMLLNISTILKDQVYCEENNGWDYYEINPRIETEEREYREAIVEIFEKLGIVGSIWVEYYLKVKSK